MPTLEDFKTKYAPALEEIKRQGLTVQNFHVQDDGKLFLRGAAPTEEAKGYVWTAFKQVDPSVSEVLIDITVDPSLPKPAAAQSYTVKSGDTLSKISKQFYGDANRYMEIYEANKDQLKDPDKIHAGQVLKIPAA